MSQIRNDGLQPVRGSSPEPADTSRPAPGERAEQRQTRTARGRASETAMAESRMQAMRTAIQRSGGILLLDNFCVDGSRLAGRNPSIPDPTADQNVAQAIAGVKEAFDALDAVPPNDFKKAALDGNTTRIVERAFDALSALDERLAAFEAERGVSAASQSLRDASMARLCELSRFVGAMQAEAMTEEQRQQQGIRGFEALRSRGSVREMLGDLAVTMHGNDPATRKVALRAEKLFTDLQALKTEKRWFSSFTTARAIKNLRKDAAALITYVDTLLAPPKPGQSKSLPGEPALFRAIGDYAKAALAETDEMLRQTPRDRAGLLLRGFYSFPDARLYERCPLLPDRVKEASIAFEKETGRHISAARETCGTRDLTSGDIFFEYQNKEEILKLETAKAHLMGIRYVLNLTPPLPEPEELKRQVVSFFGNIAHEIPAEERKALAQELLNTFLPLSSDEDAKRPYLALCESLERNLLRDHDAIQREAMELAEAVNRSGTDIPVARYLPLFFEKKAALSTLVTAAMYNIAPEHLEARLDSARLREVRVLGHGLINTVRLCRYADEHGNPFDLVFKPEAEARLAGLGSIGGYADSIQVARLNMASSTVAGLLGTPQVLANSSLGFFDGRFGLFMSHAPGHTCADLAQNPESTGFNAAVAALKQNGKLGTMLANLQRELCRLEWADLLCGQGDRHQGNYLVAINPEDGSVTVTGIDNDASFSERMIGVTTVDVTNISSFYDRFYTDPGGQGPFIHGAGGRKLFAFDRASTPEHYDYLKALTETNQAFVPRHIDGETHDRLMALDAERYRETLRPFLSEAALEVAILRLESAKALAREVATSGGCLRGDDWKHPGLLVTARREVDDLGYLSAEKARWKWISHEFFVRDFPELIKDVAGEEPLPRPAVQTP